MDNESIDLLYEVDDRGNRTLVRSIEANQRVYLRFTNKTSRPVDVWWRDYRGYKQMYVRIPPRHSFNIDSFLTHPWEFTDSDTRERYVINNRILFRAPRSLGGLKQRTNWNITVSVQSLRHTALLALGLNFKDSKEIEQLELPKVLEDELKALIALIKTPRHPNPME